MELKEHIDRFKENEPKVDTFVNGDANTDVTPSGGGAPYPTQAKAVSKLVNVGGMIGAATLTALQAITPTYANQIGLDESTGNLYRWNGTAWISTGRNYYQDAIDNRRLLESSKLQNPNLLTADQVLFNTLPTSTTGTRTIQLRNGINQMKLVSASTGGSIVAYWDFPVSQINREFAASLTIEGLTAGSNGYVGVQQLDASNNIVSTAYSETSMTAANIKKTHKMKMSSISAGVTKIRLIANMLTTTSREMYVSNPYIALGINDEFISPVVTPVIPDVSALTARVDTLYTAFDVIGAKNKFNPALAENGKLVSYATGLTVAYADGIATGRHPVSAGNTYTFWMPTGLVFAFQPVIYTYSAGGTFLGIDHSIPSSGEVVNPSPPTGIVYSDSNRTVTFTIPNGSTIAFIQLMFVYRSHTETEFNTLVNAMQLELGSVKTLFEPYGGSKSLRLKSAALPVSSSTGLFTVTLDGTDAYIRTSYNATLDLVQQVRYGTSSVWSNNIINAWAMKTIPKATAKDATITAFASGTLLVTQGDDSTPLNYNGTYIGANHGAAIVHQVTASGHGKTFADVGSRWTQGANTFTIVRIVDANTLWLVSQNVGSTYWQFVLTSLNGLTLTHSTGATNTASFTPSSDTIVQLLSALNNHTKTILANGVTVLNAAGVYDVDYLEMIDNYDIMNPVSILSYLQSHTGTSVEQPLNVDSIASDMRVAVNFRYAANGSMTVNTQLQSKSAVNFNFAGFVQALPLNYSGKTLLQYVPKLSPIVVGSKTWNLTAIEDITTTIDVVNFLKASWVDATRPPDRMVQIVKNGANNEFGQVVGYSLVRGASKDNIRQNTNDAGFLYTSRKMYPKAAIGNIYPSNLMPANTFVNVLAYRALFDSTVLPQATTFATYEDNGKTYIVFDIHQNVTSLKLPLSSKFNGKSATVVDSNANFTLHNEIVNDGGLLVSVINGYGQATIELK